MRVVYVWKGKLVLACLTCVYNVYAGKGLEDSSNIPSQEMRGELETAKAFKQKNLETAQKTMETLSVEKKKRERELEMLRQSEPKLISELRNLREAMEKMRREMEVSALC